jgi:hypothetical protein
MIAIPFVNTSLAIFLAVIALAPAAGVYDG